MMKKLFCAAMAAMAIIGCSKEQIAEVETAKMATLQLNVRPFEVRTKTTGDITEDAKALDSLRSLEVFVFRDNGILERYKRFSVNDEDGMDPANIKIEASLGQKNIYVVANSKNEDWTGVTTEDKFLKVECPLKAELFHSYTMSGKISLNLQQSTVVNITVKRLLAKVIVRGIRTQFAHTPYEGKTLSKVKLYLTNVNGNKTFMGDVPVNPVVLNAKGYVSEDNEGVSQTALFSESISGYIDDAGYTTAHHFYCYENLLSSETATQKFTRLVLEAELDGRKYYYPVDINQPGYGWTSGIDHKGIKRNTAYTYSFTITGPGSDTPESKLVLKTITLNTSAESIDALPGYSISF